MTFTSTMAQAWIEFRIRSIELAKSEEVLDSIYSVGLQDLNRLMEFDLIDSYEYQCTLEKMQQGIKDQRIFLRAMESA